VTGAAACLRNWIKIASASAAAHFQNAARGRA
jgi:hypothetical protein